MTPDSPRIAYLAAGAAGMICGSCLRDNALVLALRRLGVDATLIPTYTPLRTDEQDASLHQVFYGGVNIFLQQRVPLFRHLPGFMVRWLDLPWFIRRATRRSVTPSPRMMGELTVSMLQGAAGRQRKEVDRLADWLCDSLQPQLINYTNILIAGSAPTLKQRLNVPIVVTLQGDDLFLDSLPDTYRQKALDEIRKLANHVDAFVVFNQYYADHMRDYLQIPSARIQLVPLGINASDFAASPERLRSDRTETTIGYLARLAPEKGLHQLVDAFIQLWRDDTVPRTRLLIAGWMGASQQEYAHQQFQRLDQAGLSGFWEYRGEVDRAGKRQFFADVDLFSVPTIYPEAKGLYVLEAMAAGVPVVLPAHGSFPELVASTGGGLLCRPHDSAQLAKSLAELLGCPDERQRLGRTGQAAVAARHSADVMARETWSLYQQLLS
jgi:glycosyltransferase involved in cell wall biosynthesis